MTLLATEIHKPGQRDATVVFAADRRITRGIVRDSAQPKVFRIPRLSAGLGYFGLAEVPDGRTKQPMAAWLKRFISGCQAPTLGAFAADLAANLNDLVPRRWRRTYVSGFHVCGLVAAGHPEFWYVRNCDDTAAQKPTGSYAAREDFQRRDACRLGTGKVMVYRNGDIRAHVLAWGKIDQALLGLLQAPDFKGLTMTAAYVRWVKFKMGIIADFYEPSARYQSSVVPSTRSRSRGRRAAVEQGHPADGASRRS